MIASHCRNLPFGEGPGEVLKSLVVMSGAKEEGNAGSKIRGGTSSDVDGGNGLSNVARAVDRLPKSSLTVDGWNNDAAVRGMLPGKCVEEIDENAYSELALAIGIYSVDIQNAITQGEN